MLVKNFKWLKKTVWQSLIRLSPVLPRLLISVYPYLISVSFFLLLIEVVSYSGFIRRYIFLPASLAMQLTVAVGAYLVWYVSRHANLVIKFNSQTNFIYQFNRVLITPIFIGHYLIQKLEEDHFANYVFSSFHIMPENTGILFTFSIFLLILDALNQPAFRQFILKSRLGLLQLVFFFQVGLILIPQLQVALLPIVPSTVSILQYPHKTKTEKMLQLMNWNADIGWMVTLGEFINRHTPETATIYIPPQKFPWLMEGNPFFFRWFVYPRTLISGPSSELIEQPFQAKYIMIASGGWPSATGIGWPKMDISAEQIESILLINRETLKEELHEQTDYIFADHLTNWGLITLKTHD